MALARRSLLLAALALPAGACTLSLPGVVAGSLLCFIPITGEFVIPDLLGGSVSTMIGQTLWSEFFTNKDWPVASALAVVLLVVLVIPFALLQAVEKRRETAG